MANASGGSLLASGGASGGARSGTFSLGSAVARFFLPLAFFFWRGFGATSSHSVPDSVPPRSSSRSASSPSVPDGCVRSSRWRSDQAPARAPAEHQD